MKRHRQRVLWFVAGGLLAAGTLAWATGGVYTSTRHGDLATGVVRLPMEPPGDCAHCHDEHASRDGNPTASPFPYLLFAPNDNQLCATAGGPGGCHLGPGALGIFPGTATYQQSVHETSQAMVWPGPDPRARPPGDAGLCLNCHTPHGRADTGGLVPSLLALREEDGCLTCHAMTGPAATPVADDFSKPHRHPAVDLAGRHAPDEGGDPSAFGATNRHAECDDCHNPHDVREGPLLRDPPTASEANQGVGRVGVRNGPAGTLPTYTFRAADDAGAVLEYEICFKCHSSWTTRPAGQPDLALLFNDNNPSFHPVEAQGQNPGVPDAAFVAPWTAQSLTWCSDCHGSDDGQVAGPHGSLHEDLLVAPHVASPALRAMAPDELCFVCHDHGTYADPASPAAVQGASRWNAPAEADGHARHVGDRNVSCFSCHESHGSTSRPFLIATGRTPGLTDWIDEGGGTRRCFSTCHMDESYTVNYP